MRIRILESAVADLAAGKDFYDRQEIGACCLRHRSSHGLSADMELHSSCERHSSEDAF
jgi:hypothetical protein